jgi:hypothetical protein
MKDYFIRKEAKGFACDCCVLNELTCSRYNGTLVCGSGSQSMVTITNKTLPSEFFEKYFKKIAGGAVSDLDHGLIDECVTFEKEMRISTDNLEDSQISFALAALRNPLLSEKESLQLLLDRIFAIKILTILNN